VTPAGLRQKRAFAVTGRGVLVVNCDRARRSSDGREIDSEMWDWKTDPEVPWWVKLRRARLHIDEVRQRLTVLDGSKPWSLERETTEDPDSCGYRFRIHRRVPADLCAAVGDAVANMRSALDYAAYKLAVRHSGALTPRQEKATAFPICKDEKTFDRFFTAGQSGPVRAEIYGQAERSALRCVQPFTLGEEAQGLGIEWSASADHELLTDGAWDVRHADLVGRQVDRSTRQRRAGRARRCGVVRDVRPWQPASGP
jgi:hypothetical protein